MGVVTACLNLNWFTTLAEAERIIENWRVDYNQNRPHSSLNIKPRKSLLLAGHSINRNGQRRLSHLKAPCPCPLLKLPNNGKHKSNRANLKVALKIGADHSACSFSGDHMADSKRFLKHCKLCKGPLKSTRAALTESGFMKVCENKKPKYGWVDVTRLGNSWKELTFIHTGLFLLLGPTTIFLFVNETLITLAVGIAYRSVSPPFLELPVLPEAMLAGALSITSLTAIYLVFRGWRRVGELGFTMQKRTRVGGFVFVISLLLCLWAATRYDTFLEEFIPHFEQGSGLYEAYIAEVKPESLDMVKEIHSALSRRLILAEDYNRFSKPPIFLAVAGLYVLLEIWLFRVARDSEGMSLMQLASSGLQSFASDFPTAQWNPRALVGFVAGIALLAVHPAITFWLLMSSIPIVNGDGWRAPSAFLAAVTGNLLLGLLVFAVPATFLLLWSRVALFSANDSKEPGILYLRPFKLDRSFVLPFMPSFDVALYLGLAESLPICAVRDPRKTTILSRAQVVLSDDAWQDYVAKEIDRARFVIISLDGTPGVKWELQQVFQRGAVHKAIFLGPAVGKVRKEDLAAIWEEVGNSNVDLASFAMIASEADLICATLSPEGRVVGYSSVGTIGTHRAIAVIRALVDKASSSGPRRDWPELQ